MRSSRPPWPPVALALAGVLLVALTLALIRAVVPPSGHTVTSSTSSTSSVLPFQVLLPRRASGLKHDSKAQAEQVRAISVDRIGALVGLLPPHVVTELDDALRLHLDL